MRETIETVTDQSLTWPDAAVIIAFIIAGACVLMTMFRGD